jgi:periplasmic divalent cation tolerance protein
MARHFQVTTTAASRDDASRLARLGVEQRLAACAQVSGPITSVYWWDRRVQTGEEWLCVFKTSAAALGPLTAALRQAHEYETPEIVAVAIDDGDGDYLAWLDTETARGGP